MPHQRTPRGASLSLETLESPPGGILHSYQAPRCPSEANLEKGPGGAGKHPEARTRGTTQWPNPLSRKQRKNPPRKGRRLVAPAADRSSRAASFARSDRRKLLGSSQSPRVERSVGLALVNIECFDALCVGCTEDCAGGVGTHRPCCYLAAPLRRLLSQFLVPPLFTELPRRWVPGKTAYPRELTFV